MDLRASAISSRPSATTASRRPPRRSTSPSRRSSKMVRQLEDEIGQPLLIRDGRQLRLTDVGKGGVRARPGRRRGHAPADAGGGRPHRTQPRRAHGGHAADGQSALSAGGEALLRTPPGIRLTLQEAGGQRIEQRVAAGELEVGATLLPVAPASGSPRAASAAPAAGRRPAPRRLAQGAGQVSLAALRDEALILLEDDFSLTRRIRRAFGDARFEPRVAARSGSGIFWWRWPPPAWAAR